MQEWSKDFVGNYINTSYYTKSLKEYVEECNSYPVEDFLNIMGVRKGGRGNFYYCPFHEDKSNPNFSVNRGKNYAYCFRCSIGGNPLTLFKLIRRGSNSGKLHGKEFTDLVYEFLIEVCKKSPATLRPKVEEDVEKFAPITLEQYRQEHYPMSEEGIRYFCSRGFSLQDIGRFNIGSKEMYGKEYISLPLIDIESGMVVSLKYRNCDKNSQFRYLNAKHSSPVTPNIFTSTLWDTTDEVIFTEDSFSAMSVNSFGFSSACMFSGNKIPYNLKPNYIKHLGNKKIYVIPDSDAAGESVYRDLIDMGLDIQESRSCGKYKDFNDMFKFAKRESFEFLLSLVGKN